MTFLSGVLVNGVKYTRCTCEHNLVPVKLLFSLADNVFKLRNLIPNRTLADATLADALTQRVRIPPLLRMIRVTGFGPAECDSAFEVQASDINSTRPET